MLRGFPAKPLRHSGKMEPLSSSARLNVVVKLGRVLIYTSTIVDILKTETRDLKHLQLLGSRSGNTRLPDYSNRIQ